jgi:hypothetical protein
MTTACNTTLRRPSARTRELTASDGFGPLPAIVPAARNRSLTRGLCTYLLWPCRRAAMPHPPVATLRTVNE